MKKRMIAILLMAAIAVASFTPVFATGFNADESSGTNLEEHSSQMSNQTTQDDAELGNSETDSNAEGNTDNSTKDTSDSFVDGFPSVDVEPGQSTEHEPVISEYVPGKSDDQQVVKSNTESYTITATNAPILSDSVIAGYPWCSLKDVYVSGRDNERQFTILGMDSTKSNNAVSMISNDDIENLSDKEIKKEYGKVIYLSADHNYFIAENGDLCFRTRGRVEIVLTDAEAQARGGLEVLLGEDYKVYP